jgi:hypothetical protein
MKTKPKNLKRIFTVMPPCLTAASVVARPFDPNQGILSVMFVAGLRTVAKEALAIK